MTAANPTPETTPTTVADIESLLGLLDAADRESGELVYVLSVHTRHEPRLVVHLSVEEAASAATEEARALNDAGGRVRKGHLIENRGINVAIHRPRVGELMAVDLYGDYDGA